VISAINKGKDIAKRNIVKVSVVNGTVPHKIIGKHGASRIMLNLLLQVQAL
jgi:small subunit ribosomal protein S5